MGAFFINNFPYIIIAVFIVLLVILGKDVKAELTDSGEKKLEIKKKPLFRGFVYKIHKSLQEEGIQVSKEFITEVIAFCILGGVNPQKIRFKEGQFEIYWEWEKAHRGIIREAELENPEKVVKKILELAHQIGEEYNFNIRREYSVFIRLKYMKHVPDIWWFAEIFEKY
ncbi:MAG: hypothetical protein U0L26_07445 [Cellulosilyticum sp.]|nr:hypothetical protein [Cellulosilyticum sp.]